MMVVVILFRLSTVDVNARFDGNDCVDDGCIDRFVELVLPAAGAIEFLSVLLLLQFCLIGSPMV